MSDQKPLSPLQRARKDPAVNTAISKFVTRNFEALKCICECPIHGKK